jgi:hypothetical protein
MPEKTEPYEPVEEEVAGWSDMIKGRTIFLKKMKDLAEFMKPYPTDYMALQAELKAAIEKTTWSIRECRMNLGLAKKRQKGLEELKQ